MGSPTPSPTVAETAVSGAAAKAASSPVVPESTLVLESTSIPLTESLAPLLRRIHPYTAAVNHLAVQGSYGLLGCLLQLHLHKAKAPGLVGEPVPNHHGGIHLAKLGKNRKKSILSGVVAEVSYINLLRHS